MGRWVFLAMLGVLLAGYASAAPIFFDNFSRSDNTNVGNGWNQNTGGWDVRHRQLYAKGTRDFLSRGNVFGSIVCLQINSYDQKTDNVFELVRSNASGARVHAAYQSTSETDGGYKRLVYFDASVNHWRVCASNLIPRPSTLWCMNMNSPYQQWIIDDYGTRKMCNMPGNHAVPDNYYGKNFLAIDSYDPSNIYLDNVCTANDLQSCIEKRSPCLGFVDTWIANGGSVVVTFRFYRWPDSCLNGKNSSQTWASCQPSASCKANSIGNCGLYLRSGDYRVVANEGNRYAQVAATVRCGGYVIAKPTFR